jgi:hypothetical protein
LAPALWPTRTTTTAPWRWPWGLTWLESILCRLPCGQLRCPCFENHFGIFCVYSFSEARSYLIWGHDWWRSETFSEIFSCAPRAGVQISNTPTPEIDVCASDCAQKWWNQLFQELAFLDRFCRVGNSEDILVRFATFWCLLPQQWVLFPCVRRPRVSTIPLL